MIEGAKNCPEVLLPTFLSRKADGTRETEYCHSNDENKKLIPRLKIHAKQ